MSDEQFSLLDDSDYEAIAAEMRMNGKQHSPLNDSDYEAIAAEMEKGFDDTTAAILELEDQHGIPAEVAGEIVDETGQQKPNIQTAAAHPNTALLNVSQVDFVIVTALEEERDAILDKLLGYQRGMPSHDDVRFYFSSGLSVIFPDGSTCVYRVVVLLLLGMGRVQATTATVDAIRRWHPRYVILVGIAGGVAAKGVNLGDVLVADQIVDYELQKLTPKGPEIRWVVHQTDPRLVGAARNLNGEGWRELITTKRPDGGSPKRHIGPIASGDKVIAFGDALAKYRGTWSQLIGVEMEASGVVAAAFQAAERPGFFMVRGVSDLADEEKDSDRVEKWRSYACDVAASYAIALLKSGPVLPSPAGERPSAAELANLLMLTASDLEKLADLLRRSGHAVSSARRALCFRIGVDPGDLDFLMHTSDSDFAVLLVHHLYQTGDFPGLLGLCDAIAPILKGPYAEALVTIGTKLQAR